MFARVSTLQGPASEVDEGIRYVRENVLPRAAQMDGYKGAYLLVDRQSGESVSVTLWESEEALRASEEAADRLRGDAAGSLGAEIASVKRYEVALTPEEG